MILSRYQGSKRRSGDKIAKIIKQHTEKRFIVDWFSGSGWMTWHLKNNGFVIVSSIENNEMIIKLAESLRHDHPEQPGLGKEDFYKLRDDNLKKKDPIAFWNLMRHAFGGVCRKGMMSYGGEKKPMKPPVNNFYFPERKHFDFCDRIIDYCDPPYYKAKDTYKIEFDHEDFVEKAKQCEGPMFISNSEAFQECVPGWKRFEIGEDLVQHGKNNSAKYKTDFLYWNGVD